MMMVVAMDGVVGGGGVGDVGWIGVDRSVATMIDREDGGWLVAFVGGG